MNTAQRLILSHLQGHSRWEVTVVGMELMPDGQEAAIMIVRREDGHSERMLMHVDRLIPLPQHR